MPNTRKALPAWQAGSALPYYRTALEKPSNKNRNDAPSLSREKLGAPPIVALRLKYENFFRKQVINPNSVLHPFGIQ
jgi:hypothetical protein